MYGIHLLRWDLNLVEQNSLVPGRHYISWDKCFELVYRLVQLGLVKAG